MYIYHTNIYIYTYLTYTCVCKHMQMDRLTDTISWKKKMVAQGTEV